MGRAQPMALEGRDAMLSRLAMEQHKTDSADPDADSLAPVFRRRFDEMVGIRSRLKALEVEQAQLHDVLVPTLKCETLLSEDGTKAEVKNQSVALPSVGKEESPPDSVALRRELIFMSQELTQARYELSHMSGELDVVRKELAAANEEKIAIAAQHSSELEANRATAKELLEEWSREHKAREMSERQVQLLLKELTEHKERSAGDLKLAVEEHVKHRDLVKKVQAVATAWLGGVREKRRMARELEIANAEWILGHTAIVGDAVTATLLNSSVERGAMVEATNCSTGDVTLCWEGGGVVRSTVPVCCVKKKGVSCIVAGVSLSLLTGRWTCDDGKSYEVIRNESGEYSLTSRNPCEVSVQVERRIEGVFLRRQAASARDDIGDWRLEEARTTPNEVTWVRRFEECSWSRA